MIVRSMETTVLEKIQDNKKVFFKSPNLEIYTREFYGAPIIVIFAKSSENDSTKGFGIEIEIYPTVLRINLFSINLFAPFVIRVHELQLDEIVNRKLIGAYKTNAIVKLLRLVSEIKEIDTSIRNFLSIVLAEIM